MATPRRVSRLARRTGSPRLWSRGARARARIRPMMRLFAVGLGGALGALARYGISGYVQRRVPNPFPAGTLVVNVVGCFLLGALVVLLESRSEWHPELRYLLAVGVLGAMTTFSTFGYETFELLRVGSHGLAFASIALNVGLGLGAVIAGRALVLFLIS